METYKVEPIATIKNNFKDKFGIPRQSNLQSSLSTIVFNEKFRDENSLRGLEGYSHIWLLWIFDKNNSSKAWSPTVRPPRLGGNTRMGVFSTRSPYHPNRIGLSCVKIESIVKTPGDGTTIIVSGADLLDGTPIIDIKPYLSFTDSHPDALCGFSDNVFDYKLDVVFDGDCIDKAPEIIEELREILEQDPRPSYQTDSDRVYAMKYACYDIKFKVDGNILTVMEIIKNTNGSEK